MVLVLVTSMAGVAAAAAAPAKRARARAQAQAQAQAGTAPRASGIAPKVAYGPLRTLLSGLADPQGMAVDGAGDVFVASASGPLVEVAKGTTQPVPLSPQIFGRAVAADAAGDVFVSDEGNDDVVELPKAGSQSVLGFTGLSGPGGVAVDGAGDVFVADTGHNRVLELPAGGAQVVLPFTGLTTPTGVAVDGAGDVFVLDSSNGRVVELPKGGAQRAVTLSGVDLPTGVAVDAAGNLYVSAVNLGVIEVPKVGPQALLGFPGVFGASGVAVDMAGDVFVSDGGTDQVEELPVGGTAVPFPPNAISAPNGLAADAAGDVFVSDFTNRFVLELPPGGVAVRLAFTGLKGPGAVAVDQAGDVFVADTGNNRVVELPKGKVQIALPFHGLMNPLGVAVDAAGDVFVTEGGQSPGVIELAPGGAQVTLPFTGLHNPVSVAVDGDGNVFAADPGVFLDVEQIFPAQMVELPRGGTQVVVPTANLTGFNAVAVDHAGDLFVSGFPSNDGASTSIEELPKGGGASSLINLPGSASQDDLAVDGAGDVFIANQGLIAVQELPIDQALFVSPVNEQQNVDTTKPFTWSTIPAAQAYYLIVGTTLYGKDLVDSGVLAPSQSSLAVGVLPSGRWLYATLFTEEGGTWTRFQVVGFSAAARVAAFTNPVNGQANVDTSKPFTWSAASNAQAYIVVVGTTKFGTNLVSSGPLPAGQHSLAVPALPGGVLYATLLTKVNGSYTHYQSVSFTAASGGAVFTHPLEAQLNVVTPGTFTWSAVAQAQGYKLIVGTTVYGHDLVNSAVLPATASSYAVPVLPSRRILYATIYTEVNGGWVNYNLIGFTAA